MTAQAAKNRSRSSSGNRVRVFDIRMLQFCRSYFAEAQIAFQWDEKPNQKFAFERISPAELLTSRLDFQIPLAHSDMSEAEARTTARTNVNGRSDMNSYQAAPGRGRINWGG